MDKQVEKGCIGSYAGELMMMSLFVAYSWYSAPKGKTVTWSDGTMSSAVRVIILAFTVTISYFTMNYADLKTHMFSGWCSFTDSIMATVAIIMTTTGFFLYRNKSKFVVIYPHSMVEQGIISLATSVAAIVANQIRLVPGSHPLSDLASSKPNNQTK